MFREASESETDEEKEKQAEVVNTAQKDICFKDMFLIFG